MNIVAIYDLRKEQTGLPETLAGALKLTVYEARSRLSVPGNGPLVVAVFAEEGPADQLAERLRAAQISAAVLKENEIEQENQAGIVKKFSLGEKEIRIEIVGGESMTVPFAEVELMLRGTGIVKSTSVETEKKSSFNLGRAVLTGGLMLTKTTKTVREVTSEEREGFLNLYAGNTRVLVFRENTLLYDSLGPLLKPSRTANFAYLNTELRRLCPSTRYDERLLNRSGQAFLLGPMFTPEEHLCVATALLAKVLRDRN